MINQVILTGQDLEDGGEEEAAALDQPEELVEEGDEGEDAEEDGEDHEGLNRLDPVWNRGPERVKTHTFTEPQRWCNLRLIRQEQTFIASWLAVVPCATCPAVVPQVFASISTYRPGLVIATTQSI